MSLKIFDSYILVILVLQIDFQKFQVNSKALNWNFSDNLYNAFFTHHSGEQVFPVLFTVFKGFPIPVLENEFK